MALQAVAVRTDAPRTAAPSPTLVPRPATGGTHVARVVALPAPSAHRRSQRRYAVLGALLFGAPFVACLGVLEVVR